MARLLTTSPRTDDLKARLTGSRVGTRWLRMLRTHRAEIESLIAVHPELRERAGTAVAALATAVTVDTAVADVVGDLFDELHRHATLGLRRDVELLRDELLLARGRSMAELLAG